MNAASENNGGFECPEITGRGYELNYLRPHETCALVGVCALEGVCMHLTYPLLAAVIEDGLRLTGAHMISEGRKLGRQEGSLDELTDLPSMKAKFGMIQAAEYVESSIRQLYSDTRLVEEGMREDQNALMACFFDGDSFKKINDTYGHQVGDDVIRFIGSCLRGNDGILKLRNGGDEFVLLQTVHIVPMLDQNDGFEYAVKIDELHRFTEVYLRERIDTEWRKQCDLGRASNFLSLIQNDIKPEFSLGVAFRTLPRVDEADISEASKLLLIETIAAADQHMYGLKQAKKLKQRFFDGQTE